MPLKPISIARVSCSGRSKGRPEIASLCLFLALGLATDRARGDGPAGGDFSYTSAKDGQVGVEIFDQHGQPVRTLQLPVQTKAGTYTISWDGLNDLGTPAPPGDYEFRVVVDPASYSSSGPIGNTSLSMGTQTPLVPGHQNPSNIVSVAVDADGAVYTADSWEEAGQDFRKWDRETGRYVQDAEYGIRNGAPNATAYAIAVDENYIYCATTSHTTHQQGHIRRFNLLDEKLAPFPMGPNIDNGHIFVYDDPGKGIPKGASADEAALDRAPLRSIVATSDKIVVADYLGNQVIIYDKNFGAPSGGVPIKMPQALAIDSTGQIWIGHGNDTVSVFNLDGTPLTDAVTGLGRIVALAFGPDHLLYVADAAAGKVLIYRVDEAKRTAVLQRTFGQKAEPPDDAADHFYQLQGLAVDSKGYLTVAQDLLVAGSRLTRFAPDGTVVWDQVGGEFCDTGNYSQDSPDDVISQYFHRYHVDKDTGRWEFHGCVIASDPKYINEQHSPMRLLKLDGHDFAFMGYGTGLQAYRLDGEVYRLCSMFGSASPNLNGIFTDTMPGSGQAPPGLWSWHDANRDGKVNADEVVWQVKPSATFQFSNLGVNVDNQGNALYCSGDGDVTEVPLSGFDANGYPVYDLAKTRILVPHDPSPTALLCGPRMVVRADDGSLYVDSQSKVYPAPPEAGPGWMTGWMLARYDKGGRRLWYARIPETCPGMDFVPGGGVMLITSKYGPHGAGIYHYSTDGDLLGIANPSNEELGFSAVPDNTGSLSISRDPRDGVVDMFAEDCVGNRFRWQRMDDSQKPQISNTWLRLKQAGQPLEVIPAPKS